MNCQYCRAVNSEDDHRCQRCGRRLQDGPGAVPGYSREAAARVLEPAARAVETPAAVRTVGAAIQYQRALFSQREFPSPMEIPVNGGASRTGRAAEKPRARRPRPSPGQRHLDFPNGASAPQQNAPLPGTTIDCDALTAVVSARVAAFAFDATIMLSGIAIFLTALHYRMGAIPLDKRSLPWLAGAALLIAGLYKALWCLGNGDSPGMRWAKLRLITFDGREPTRRQRIRRALSGAFVSSAMGLGLMWALVDEEALTWHDHISKTFPTSD